LEIMHELGLLETFLARPHQELRELRGIVGDSEIKLADFAHLPTRCRFIALMPQWDFLNFLAEGRQPIPRLSPGYGERGHRSCRGGRPHRRGARTDARRDL